MQLPRFIDDLLNLVYPELCIICESRAIEKSQPICLNCLKQLPRTGFHQHGNNRVFQIFTGRVPINRATAFLYFEKSGITQKILHQIKYKSNTEIGYLMGAIAGRELSEAGFLKDIDYLIPIPLHPKKFEIRGYNQSEIIAKGMSDASGIEILNDLVRRKKHNSSQTKKSRYQRWENVQDIFELDRRDTFSNKHVLIVDDVTTTGSTIEACAVPLLGLPSLQVSIFCLAFAP